MPRIRSNDDLIKYTEAKLGGGSAGIVNVEITPEQWIILIDDAIQDFYRYNIGDGTFFQYGIMQLVAGKTQYNLRDVSEFFPRDVHGEYIANTVDLDNVEWDQCSINIEQVLEVKASNSFRGGVNDMFTPVHAWYQYGGGKEALNAPYGETGKDTTDVTSFVTGTTSSMSVDFSSYDAILPMTSYFLAMQNLAMLEKLFGTEYECHWRPDAGILNLFPTPKTNQPAMISYWARENRIFLYNNIIFKKYMVACAKEQWGINLSKFTRTLVGDGEINAETIRLEGAAEKEKILTENIKGESFQCFFFKG